MPDNPSFIENAKNKIMAYATIYKSIFVEYEYLVCSEAFVYNNYYIIDAKPDNYPHLTGVNLLISAQDFFDKCCDGTLEESDFDLKKKGKSEKDVKGSVKRKVSVLPDAMKVFDDSFLVEENFIKNSVSCNIATSDNRFTLGFIDVGKSRPMTLLKGNELDLSKAKKISLLLRKHISKEKFDELIIGNDKTLIEYYDLIKDLIEPSLIMREDKTIDNNEVKTVSSDESLIESIELEIDNSEEPA